MNGSETPLHKGRGCDRVPAHWARGSDNAINLRKSKNNRLSCLFPGFLFLFLFFFFCLSPFPAFAELTLADSVLYQLAVEGMATFMRLSKIPHLLPSSLLPPFPKEAPFYMIDDELLSSEDEEENEEEETTPRGYSYRTTGYNNATAAPQPPTTSSTPLWFSLPLELQLEIWLFLPPREIFKQSLVCSAWRDCWLNEVLWREAHNR